MKLSMWCRTCTYSFAVTRPKQIMTMAAATPSVYITKRFFAFTSPSRMLLSQNANIATNNDSAETKKDISNRVRHQIRTRDITLRVASADNTIRISFCNATHLTRQVIGVHELLHRTNEHIPFLRLLGTQVLFTNLLSSLQEGEERVECMFTSSNANIMSQALALGECRCHVSSPQNDETLNQGVLPLTLQVKRILYGETSAFTSTTRALLDELVSLKSNTSNGIISVNNNTLKNNENSTSFSLVLPVDISAFTTKLLQNYFRFNLTLHAYNWLRRSDGQCSSVGLFCFQKTLGDTSISDEIMENDAVDCKSSVSVGVELEEKSKADRRNESNSEKRDVDDDDDVGKIASIIANAFGVLITPLAAGEEVEAYVLKLQAALVRASLCCEASPSELQHNEQNRELSLRFAELRRDWEVHHTTCQDILSLVTGDYHGSLNATRLARQYTNEDINDVRQKIQPIRQLLQIDERVIPLDASKPVRTAIDFFCRCSKKNFAQSLVSLGEEMWAHLQTHRSIKCVFCNKQYSFSDDEWLEMEHKRALLHRDEMEQLEFEKQ